MPDVLPETTHFQIVVTLATSLKVVATVIGASIPLPTRFQPDMKLMLPVDCVVVVVLATVVVLVVVAVLVVIDVVVVELVVVVVVEVVVLVEVVVVVVVASGRFGVALFENADAALVPAAFVAVTVKV